MRLFRPTVLLLALLAASCSDAPRGGTAEPAPRPASPAEPGLKAVIIDVRSKEEWDEGHLEGAVLIPHDEIAAKIGSVVTDKATPVTLYCAAGGRAGLAKETLEKLGYTRVVNAGGYEELKKKIPAKH